MGNDSKLLDEFVDSTHFNKESTQKIYSSPNNVRYDYFVKRVARSGSIWGLIDDDGWITSTDENNIELFLIWPDSIFARMSLEAHGTKLWPEAEVENIPIQKWMASYLPDIICNNDKVWVFPGKQLQGGVVEPSDLMSDLVSELYSISRS